MAVQKKKYDYFVVCDSDIKNKEMTEAYDTMEMAQNIAYSDRQVFDDATKSMVVAREIGNKEEKWFIAEWWSKPPGMIKWKPINFHRGATYVGPVDLSLHVFGPPLSPFLRELDQRKDGIKREDDGLGNDIDDDDDEDK